MTSNTGAPRRTSREGAYLYRPQLPYSLICYSSQAPRLHAQRASEQVITTVYPHCTSEEVAHGGFANA
jgi:hypothetical protein